MSGECDKCNDHALECGCNSFYDSAKKSEFYHFGILPQICIHSLMEDEYSKMYTPREKCSCGYAEWLEGKMYIVKSANGYKFPQKDVHRCKNCNEVRMADLIAINESNNHPLSDPKV